MKIIHSLRPFPFLKSIPVMLLTGCATLAGLAPALQAQEKADSLQVVDKPAHWAQDRSDLKPDSKTIFGRLPNGVRYAVLPHSEPPKKVSARFYIDTGSLMEEDDQQGLAHFLEHMAFNGTTHFPADEMVEFFQRLGMAFGADTNAHTSFKETVYKLELPEPSEAMLDKGLLFFADVAGNMFLADKELEKERGVIMSEKLARDDVDYRMMIEGFKFSLPDSLIPRRLPIGQDKIIQSAPRQRFSDYYKKWYTPERMAVVVVGDIDPALVVKTITAQFSNLKAPAKPAADPDLGPVTPSKGLEARLLPEKEAGAVTINIESSKPSRQRPDTAVTRHQDLVRALADVIVNRRLEILAKKPGNPFISAGFSADDWMRYLESATLQLNAKPENWDKALAAGEQEIRRAVLHGFTEAELTEAKANTLTAYENASLGAGTRKSRELADSLVKRIANDEVFTHPTDDLARVKTDIASISVKESHEAFVRDWGTDNLRIFVAGNLTLDNAPDSILNAFRTSRSQEVTAPVQLANDAFAYTDFGDSGKVTAQKTVEDLKITQVTFANGVRLNIKPTDFKKDTITISALLGSGRLTLPKDKPGLDVFAASVLDLGGFEKHSVDDLQRLLAGRTVGTQFIVGEENFIIAGRTTRKDLLLECQLLAAQLSAPGWREDGIGQFRESLPAMYQQLNHTAEGIMQSKVNAFTHGNDYRFVLPPQEVLASRTMDEVKAWLSPVLTKGYLEIGVVGDLDPQEVITAMAATVGALPARETARQDVPEARKIAFPTNERDKAFPFTSKIPKSIIGVYWPTTDRMNNIRQSRHMTLLSEILDDRVRLKIREELGESYSPQVASMMSDTFPDYGQTFAMMITEPKHADKLGPIVRDLAAKLAEGGATADELDRARKPLLTALEEQRRNNAYWLSTVVAPSQSQPQRLDWARSMIEDFTGATLTDLNALAKQYLKADKSVITRITAEEEKPTP
ncbi:MAG: peptidase [Verrucomicrobiales bacterium]|nr:peptidase [Verrucomicrobiales bacterium]